MRAWRPAGMWALGAVAGLTSLVSPALSSAAGTRPAEMLLLEDRIYFGRSAFSECLLSVFVVSAERGADTGRRGEKTLQCRYWDDADGTFGVTRDLPVQEADGLLAAIEAAELLDSGGGTGRDPRSLDGVLRILHANIDHRSIAVVVSGNEAFEADGPRRQLVELLDGIRTALHAAAVE